MPKIVYKALCNIRYKGHLVLRGQLLTIPYETPEIRKLARRAALRRLDDKEKAVAKGEKVKIKDEEKKIEAPKEEVKKETKKEKKTKKSGGKKK